MPADATTLPAPSAILDDPASWPRPLPLIAAGISLAMRMDWAGTSLPAVVLPTPAERSPSQPEPAQAAAPAGKAFSPTDLIWFG